MPKAGPIISGAWPRLQPGATQVRTPGTAALAPRRSAKGLLRTLDDQPISGGSAPKAAAYFYGPEDVLFSSNGPRRHQLFAPVLPVAPPIGDNAPETMGRSLPNRRTI